MTFRMIHQSATRSLCSGVCHPTGTFPVTDRDGTVRRRPSSQAFSDSTKPTASPMSTYRVLDLDSPDDALKDFHDHGLVSIEVGFVREACQQRVAPDPDPVAPAGHTYVIGKKTKGVRNLLATHASEVRPPPRIVDTI